MGTQITNWVADSILEKEDSGKRAIVVEHFISVADVRLFFSLEGCGTDRFGI